MNELIAGVRADVAVKVYGDDLEQLHGARRCGGERCRARWPAPPTSSSSRSRACRCSPITPNRAALARYGLNLQDVQDTVSIALGGGNAGQLFEGDRRFDIVVRLPEAIRTDIDQLHELPVPLPGG